MVAATKSLASNRFHAIDVLRGAAAIAVLLSHYVPHLNRYAEDVPAFVSMEFGHYAVKLFFAISGFVIFYSLNRCSSLTDFAVLRASRLYPAYWASMVMAVFVDVVLLRNPFWLGGIVTNLTMFQEYLGFPHLDTVYWSLSVELAFYFIAAMVFFASAHRKPLAVVFVWLIVTILWSQTLFEYSPGNAVRSGWLARIFALDYAPYFAIGMILFDVSIKGWRTVSLFLILLAILVEYLMFRIEGLLVASSVAAILGLAVHGRLNFLVCKPTLWLGGISYSLYLLHKNIGIAAINWLLPYIKSGWLTLILITAAMLALSTLLNRVVEVPALHAIRLVYERRTKHIRRRKTVDYK